MAPLIKPVKKDMTDRRIQQILDIANRTCALLKDRSTIPASLVAELESVIKRSFPLPSSTALAGKSSAFDTLGSQLWNAATSVIREEEDQDGPRAKRNEIARLVVLLRTLAFLLVDAAHHTSSRRTGDRDQRVRTFKLANKACRFCLDHGELELALKVLERCSEYVSQAEEEVPIVQIADVNGGNQGDIQLILRRLVAGYYLLRMTHAWKSARFDVADHFFNKLGTRELTSSAPLAENAADLFHEAGKSLAGKQMSEPAIKWCERALSTLDACDVEDLSQDAPELRLAITATFVDMLLVDDSEGNSDRAEGAVDQLESAYGMSNRIAVSVMRFQILTARQPVDVGQLSTVLQHMMRLSVMTDKSFKTIMQTTHKTKRFSAHAALVALHELVTHRLLPDLPPDAEPESVARDRMEKGVVTYVLFATTQTEVSPMEAITSLQALFDSLIQRSNALLSTKATHAAQTLIWKTAGASSANIADSWYKLLQHPAFDGAGQLNKARIGRKAVVTALARTDFDAAREAFFEMPQAIQDEPITRYLAFKLALRSSDYELANESLQVVTKHADKDPTFLYACVLEAQQSELRHIAVAALQSLLDKLPPGVHLPSLLRCTARLLIGELNAQERATDEVVEEVVLLFERAGSHKQALKQGTDDQWRFEIQWWSKNAYNLAVRLCADLHPEYLVRLLAVCTKFIESSPNDGGLMHQDDLHRRKLICHFLSTSALIVLARSGEEDSEYVLQCYLRARQEIVAFMRHAKQLEGAYTEAERNDTAAKETSARSFELLKFNLECILRLQQWDQLDQAVQAFLSFKDADRWDSLADLALIVHDQASTAGVTTNATARIPELLQKCINETWKKEKDITKMSRWLRLTFTIHLQDNDSGLALKIVEQAASIAQKGWDGHADVYPGDELQWLATMAFNKGVDALSAGDGAGSKVWVEAALELARYEDDNGALHAHLTYKRRAAEARMTEAQA